MNTRNRVLSGLSRLFGALRNAINFFPVPTQLVGTFSHQLFTPQTLKVMQDKNGNEVGNHTVFQQLDIVESGLASLQ